MTSFKLHPTTSNKSQQHATTHNMVCKRSQHVGPNNVASCWPTMMQAFARAFSPSSERIEGRIEGLTLETSAFRISVRWPIYIINSVDKTKFLYTTSPPTQHHSFFRNCQTRRSNFLAICILSSINIFVAI